MHMRLDVSQSSGSGKEVGNLEQSQVEDWGLVEGGTGKGFIVLKQNDKTGRTFNMPSSLNSHQGHFEETFDHFSESDILKRWW